MTHQLKALSISVAILHLTCLAMMFIYGHTIAHVVVAAYGAWFGDMQASYERYARLAMYVAMIAITSPATLVSLLVFDRLVHREVRWKRLLIGFFAWQLAAVAIIIWSYELGLSYILNQLDWTLFGPPENLYGLRNIVFPRLVGWLLCTTPVACIALSAYFASPQRFSLRTLVLAMTLVAVLLGILAISN